MPDNLSERVAEWLDEEMAKERLTQQEVAAVLGINQTNVSRRLRGTCPFQLREIDALADYFETPVETILGLAEAARTAERAS